jgi:hypothetical protein
VPNGKGSLTAPHAPGRFRVVYNGVLCVYAIACAAVCVRSSRAVSSALTGGPVPHASLSIAGDELVFDVVDSGAPAAAGALASTPVRVVQCVACVCDRGSAARNTCSISIAVGHVDEQFHTAGSDGIRRRPARDDLVAR